MTHGGNIRQRRLQKALDDFPTFVRLMWPVIDPGHPLVWGWVMEVMCAAIQEWATGNPAYRKLLMCVPPGFAKSVLGSVMAPAWQWLNEPERTKLCLAKSNKVVRRDARKVRSLIDSRLYQELLRIAAARDGLSAPRWRMVGRALKEQVNSAHGVRYSQEIGSDIIGQRGDDLHLDDLLDVKDMLGSIEQVNAKIGGINEVVDVVLPSRVHDVALARWLFIMQRLHKDDPAGQAMKEGGWHVITIQMEFDPDFAGNHPDDPRTEPGELAFPERFPMAEVRKLRTKLGERQYQAQYQQRPTPPGGNMFQRVWFQRYDSPPWVHARACEELAITVDCASKKGRSNDFTAIQVWGRIGANRYLLDQVHARLEYTELRDAMRAIVAKWRTKGLPLFDILIEDASNGVPLLQELRGEISGMLAISPSAIGGKVVRARWTESAAQALQIFLPKDEHAPWAQGWIEEHVAFPAVSHDDRVDATSQLMWHWSAREAAVATWDVPDYDDDELDGVEMGGW